MTDTPIPLDLAAELVDVLAPDDGERVDPEFEARLPGWAEEDPDPEAVAAPRRRWRVDSDERADYACRRVMLADEERRRVLDFAATQKAQIDAWAAERTTSIDGTRAFFLGSAIDFARRLRMADPGFRTLPLPCGWKLTAHDSRAGVDVDGDGDTFCAWALEHEHDEVVKVTTKPVLREIPKRYRVSPDGTRYVDPETSELVPGIAPRPAGWSADAKPPTARAEKPTAVEEADTDEV